MPSSARPHTAWALQRRSRWHEKEKENRVEEPPRRLSIGPWAHVFCRYIIVVGIGATAFARLPPSLTRRERPIDVVPVLFQQGINERAALATYLASAGSKVWSRPVRASHIYILKGSLPVRGERNDMEREPRVAARGCMRESVGAMRLLGCTSSRSILVCPRVATVDAGDALEPQLAVALVAVLQGRQEMAAGLVPLPPSLHALACPVPEPVLLAAAAAVCLLVYKRRYQHFLARSFAAAQTQGQLPSPTPRAQTGLTAFEITGQLPSAPPCLSYVPRAPLAPRSGATRILAPPNPLRLREETYWRSRAGAMQHSPRWWRPNKAEARARASSSL